MAMMESVAMCPISVASPAAMYVPPAGIISPIPRRVPCVPSGTPKPIIDDRTIHIHRLDNIVGSVDILIADNLNGHIVRLVFLHIDGGNILVDILGKDSLQDNQTFAPLTGFYYAEVIHLSVSIEVEVAESAVRIVEHHLELLQVFSFRKKLSYHLQIQSL